MPLSIEFNTAPDKWWDCVLKSEQYSVFSSKLFLSSLKNQYDLVSITKNNHIEMAALILKDDYGNPIQDPLNFTLYQGIYFSEKFKHSPAHRKYKQQLDLIEFLLFHCSNFYDYVTLSIHHSVNDLRAFQWFNHGNDSQKDISLGLNYTGLINLGHYKNNFEFFLSEIRAVRRQELKRNDRFIVESGNHSDIQTLLNFHKDTLEASGAKYDSKYPEVIASIAKCAIDNDYGEILVCRNDFQEIISANLFVWDQNTSYYLFGATNQKYKKLSTGTSLILKAIDRSIKRGNSYIDLVGINSPNRGDYKLSFNAIPHSYCTIKIKAKN